MASYDLLVIGAGPGGYVAAIRAAQLGMKTAIAEYREVGGTCLNRGCIPTKTLLHSARLYRELSSSDELGLQAEGLRFDFARIHHRKEEVVLKLREGIEGLLRGNRIDRIQGRAFIEAPSLIRVGGETVTAERILIAVGGSPALPPIPGVELPGVFSSDELLEEQRFFPRLTIVGGGVIGMEFASLYSDLGGQVTVLEAMDRILPGMDREISQNLSMILRKRGVRLLPRTKLSRIEGEGELFVITEEQEERIPSDGVLIAVGRKPNTRGLCAPDVDLQLTRGFIPVNAQFETCIPGIYAVGDVMEGGIQLAHAASAQGIRAVCAMAGKSCLGMDVIPSCVYTDPEIAAVGMTADEGKAAGIPVKTGKALLSANGKTLIEGQERGFVKLVFHGETKVLIGAQLMCGRASDLIGELTAAVQTRATLSQLLEVVRPHPTFCEAITEAACAAEGMAINGRQR